MQSVRQVATAHGVTERTVRNWLEAARKERGSIGIMRAGKLLFTSEEVDGLAQYGRSVELDGDSAPSVVVEDGNHREVRDISVPNMASLERFRTDRIRQALANPAQFVSQVDGFLDELELGMDAAEERQEDELNQTRRTKRTALQRVERFRRRADEYRLKTDILATIQNAELDEIGDIADEVADMGKSDGGSPEDGLS
jgi:hypothetical protein